MECRGVRGHGLGGVQGGAMFQYMVFETIYYRAKQAAYHAVVQQTSVLSRVCGLSF